MKMRTFVGRLHGKLLSVLLAVVMATGPAARLQAQPPTQPEGAEIRLDLPAQKLQVVEPTTREIMADDKTLLAHPAAGKIDLTYVTPQAAALVSLRPQQLLTSPNTAMLPVEVVSAAGLEHLGVDPADVVEAVLFLEPPSIVGLQYGAVIKFAKPFLELPNLISAIDLAFNITNPGPTLLAIHAGDAASADKIESLYRLAQDIQRKNATAQAAELQRSNDPIQRAFGKYVERMSKSNVETYKYQRHGDDLILFRIDSSTASPQNQLVMVAVTGILVALLLPAIQAAREAARRSQSMNNIKNLLLALLNYHDVRKAIPANANYSPDGKPLLSWRVHILPFLQEGELYGRFKLDEPWDSEHNRKLIEKMPTVYANPNLTAASKGKTNYLAVVGEECVFDGTSTGVKLRQITDGLSNTIVLVEAAPDRAVTWTKPEDWRYDPKNPMAGLGGLRPSGWLAGWADGHVSFVADTIDRESLSRYFTRSSNEVVPVP